ncbi:UNVERIFIED_CONTAM: hypothetical protein FKN15_016990 [Acipenser sinensis]
MIRFVTDSIPEEHLIGLLELHQLDAEYITTQILQYLSEVGFNADNIISQCCDGASVMSGVNGGVQALLQRKLGRHIPYLHCYNHQLHLVVVHAILYAFLHRHYITQKCNGPSLKRLLEIHWTSHLEVTKCVVDNQDLILDKLSEV